MFVERDSLGQVNGIFNRRQYEGQEELPNNHPELFKPSPDHVYINGAWVLDQSKVEERMAAEVDAKDRLLFEINFDQENRIRALEGKNAVTRAQYRDALIARWRLLRG
jgi:hypothetical protein